MKRAKPIQRFFAYAQERHRIYLRRVADSREPWTYDPVLQKYRFCCVFREHDRTTRWFREHVREPMRDDPRVLLATVVFRLFNRIRVGEAVFKQLEMLTLEKNEQPEHSTAFDLFCDDGDERHLRRAIKAYCGKGPYTTGAYIISSPPGFAKLDGVLRVLRDFWRKDDQGWRRYAFSLSSDSGIQSLQTAWDWLRRYDYLGPFHSYEVVTDLRHTALLEKAYDVNSWANPGPGARRGLNRIHGRDLKERVPREQQIEEMREVLQLSRDSGNWSGGEGKDWPAWEMREVEHTLCEFDKYERTLSGEGRPRGVFR